MSTKDEKIAQTKERIARMEQDAVRIAQKIEQAKAKLSVLEAQ